MCLAPFGDFVADTLRPIEVTIYICMIKRVKGQ